MSRLKDDEDISGKDIREFITSVVRFLVLHSYNPATTINSKMKYDFVNSLESHLKYFNPSVQYDNSASSKPREKRIKEAVDKIMKSGAYDSILDAVSDLDAAKLEKLLYPFVKDIPSAVYKGIRGGKKITIVVYPFEDAISVNGKMIPTDIPLRKFESLMMDEIGVLAK